MTELDPWLVIPCSGARVGELDRLLDLVRHPAERTVVVTTNADPVADDFPRAFVVRLSWTGWYISRWWNAGLDHAAANAPGPTWEVLVTSSDLTDARADSITTLATALRALNVVMAGPDWLNLGQGRPLLMGADDHRDVAHRVPGACWMLAGETGLRCDERYRWWYTDDDLEAQARRRGQVALVPGTGLGPDVANDMGADRGRFATEDRRLYVTKWGREPW